MVHAIKQVSEILQKAGATSAKSSACTERTIEPACLFLSGIRSADVPGGPFMPIHYQIARWSVKRKVRS